MNGVKEFDFIDNYSKTYNILHKTSFITHYSTIYIFPPFVLKKVLILCMQSMPRDHKY